jgi:phospholipase/carboxylesterase
MMSLHLAPRKQEKIGGVIGIAGMMMQPELLEKEVLQKPPILLVHGDQDDVVPYKELSIAADALEKSEFEVYTLTSKGTGHSIAEDGLRAALKFIKDIL